MKKPRKNEPRQTIEKILHKFYKLTVWDAKTNKDLTQEEIDALEEEFFFYQFDTNLYEYDIEHENYRDISVLLPALQKVEKEYSEKYDKIELVPHYNIDGYHICTQIIGIAKKQMTNTMLV